MHDDDYQFGRWPCFFLDVEAGDSTGITAEELCTLIEEGDILVDADDNCAVVGSVDAGVGTVSRSSKIGIVCDPAAELWFTQDATGPRSQTGSLEHTI